MDEIEKLKRRTEVLFHKRQKRLAKVVSFLRKEPVGDAECNRFAGTAESFGFFYEFGRLHAHLFQRMLERRERGGHCARVAWKMQNPRHFCARFAVRACERHGQRAFD